MASAISPVASKPTAVSSPAPADWSAATKNTYDHGVEADMSPFPLTRGLADINGATNQTHHASYMNLWGGKDSDNKFQYNQVSLVDEDWQLSNGKFHIDQWLFQANSDGSGIQATHGYVDEDTTGSVLGTGNYKTTDAEASAKVGGLVSKWAKFQPTAHTNIAFRGEQPADRNAAAKHVATTMTANGFSLRAPAAKSGVSLRY